MSKVLANVGHSVSVALPHKLRKRLNLIYRKGNYTGGVADMVRDLLAEAADRRILQMDPRISEALAGGRNANSCISAVEQKQLTCP